MTLIDKLAGSAGGPSPEMIAKVARAICPAILQITGDYQYVPVDEVFSRPRYLFLKIAIEGVAEIAIRARATGE